MHARARSKQHKTRGRENAEAEMGALAARKRDEAKPATPPSHERTKNFRGDTTPTCSSTSSSSSSSPERSPVSKKTSRAPSLGKDRRRGRTGGAMGVVTNRTSEASDDGVEEVEEATRCLQMTHVGAQGKVPNLFWHAPHEEQLRRHPRFRALPPAHLVALGSEASYQFVRQGTALWDDLHAGRLTTGCLNGALGLQEEGVHRAFAKGKRGGCHRPLMSAYYQLREEPLEHTSNVKKLMSAEAEVAANQAAVNGYNAALMEAGPASPSPPPSPPPAADDNDDDAGDYHGSLRVKSCRRAAKRGEAGVRLAWGKAQKAGTIATLMLHYAESVAEEVGLCVMDREEAVPKNWNVGPLPPIAATPDGIINLPKRRDGNDKSSAAAGGDSTTSTSTSTTIVANGGGLGRVSGVSASASASRYSSSCTSSSNDEEEDDDDTSSMRTESTDGGASWVTDKVKNQERRKRELEAEAEKRREMREQMEREKKRRDEAEDAAKDYIVFVGGVPYTVLEPELFDLFSKMTGSVESIKLVKEKGKTHKHKGFGFIKFATKEAASHVRALGKVMFNGIFFDVGEPVRKEKTKEEGEGEAKEAKESDVNGNGKDNGNGDWGSLGIVLGTNNLGTMSSGPASLYSVDGSPGGGSGGDGSSDKAAASGRGEEAGGVDGAEKKQKKQKKQPEKTPEERAAEDADREFMVFVGGMPYILMEPELTTLFSPWGTVESIRLVREKNRERRGGVLREHKGYGFVKFTTKEAASNVRAAGRVMYNGLYFDVGEPQRNVGRSPGNGAEFDWDSLGIISALDLDLSTESGSGSFYSVDLSLNDVGSLNGGGDGSPRRGFGDASNFFGGASFEDGGFFGLSVGGESIEGDDDDEEAEAKAKAEQKAAAAKAAKKKEKEKKERQALEKEARELKELQESAKAKKAEKAQKERASRAAYEADKDRAVFVGGVPPAMPELDLACAFSEFGHVKSVRIFKHEDPEKKGYGFVKFATKEAANDALAEAKVILNGDSMYVREVIREGDSNDGGGGGGGGGEEERERLVVEVKSASPFRASADDEGRFEVTDRDHFDTPPAHHMPQLQMGMLAAGTRAGLLCLQSATRGVRVFRVERDDAYVRGMLELLSEFYTSHVLTGVEPPVRMFANRRQHKDLVKAAVRMARDAVLVDDIPKHLMLPGEEYDLRPFVAERAR